MNISLQNKNVLITGAATGIGRAMAKVFAGAQANVFVNHFNQRQQVDELVSEIDSNKQKVYAINADVSHQQSVIKMTEDIINTHGAIDILINNAGISVVKPFLEITEDDWDKTLNTNLKSVVFCSQAVIPAMLEKGEGVIINMVSELGYLGREKFAAYTASKGALITLTRTLAREFAPTIRVNGIAPGPVMTDLLRGEIKTQEDLEKEKDLPMQCIAEADDIAGSAVFLASDYAKFYCGDILSPNGGSLMR